MLGISTVLTTNTFVITFNTFGILLLITVFMLRQMYDDREWNFGQYLCNILFLYLCMIPEVASPFIHMGNHLKKNRKEEVKNKNTKYIIFGIIIGLPMLIVVIELLSSADAIFSKVVGEIFHNLWSQIVFSPNVFLVMGLIIVGFFGSYCFLSALTLNNMPEWKQKTEKKNPVTAITFTSMITLVYLIFCGIQLLFLFTGGKILPEGYTYAEYAHQGFFQLLFVCIFNLILVVCCIAVFDMSKWLKTVLLVFSGCTYIMIASSAWRMILYIETYHLSFLRVLVLWFLAMLVVLMAGVMINIVREKLNLFRYSMTVVTVFYLVFSFGRVDYFIAKYNISQMGEAISLEDVEYLTNLSMDAVPALAELSLEHKYDDCNIPKDTRPYEYDYSTYSRYFDKYDYYDEENMRNFAEEEGHIYAYDCRACALEQEMQWILDSNEDMNLRTFNFSKFWAVKTAENAVH